MLAYVKLGAKEIAKEAQISPQKTSSFSSLMNTQGAKSIQTAAAIDRVEDDIWSLGGYCPFAYKITPWSSLFPKLKDIKLPTTFTSTYIAKIYMYYFTKLQFSSYLYFLADAKRRL